MFHHTLSKLVIANWKMNGNIAFAEDFLTRLVEQYDADNVDNVQIVVCPPANLIATCYNILNKYNNHNIILGAQDCSEFPDNGPFTGEISAKMLKEVGCKYVVIGHSEVRKAYQSTDESIKQKMILAQQAGMIPILCVGETLQKKGQKEVIYRQIIENITEDMLKKQIVIAYEPIWAIGTGHSASTSDIEHVYQDIKQAISDIHKGTVELDTLPLKLIYGGSVSQDNTPRILACEGYDGMLVGGNSLVIANFWAIVKAANQFIGVI